MMTLFADDRYDWRETYFVYFELSQRPKLSAVRRALQTFTPFFNILTSKAEPDGNLVEMTIVSYEDHAALEIIYREGSDILAEAKHLACSLKKEATAEELAQLKKIAQCRTRFDIHHFEQMAGTAVFNTTKLPELKFSQQSTYPIEHGDIFLRVLGQSTADKGKFYFDPDSYDRCRYNRVGKEFDIADESIIDNGDFERINPEMLVAVLEILCHISRGVVLDPASGIVL